MCLFTSTTYCKFLCKIDFIHETYYSESLISDHWMKFIPIIKNPHQTVIYSEITCANISQYLKGTKICQTIIFGSNNEAYINKYEGGLVENKNKTKLKILIYFIKRA